MKGTSKDDSVKKELDNALLVEVKLGNESAFRQLFTQWEKPLFNYIYKLTGSQQDAEDICQETFTTLWLSRGSIDPSKNIKTYIYLIARQITWKLFRALKHREGFLPETGACDNVSPESIVQLREMELLAELAIAKLPSRTRQMYNLHYKNNLSYEEIADLLGTNPVNVKTQIYQARLRIREIISVLIYITLS